MKKPMHVTIPITKVDEDQRMVYGYATVEEIDSHGEIITYEASKKAFSDWIGNIREMHKDIAVGKAIEVEFDDEAKGIWIGAKISESVDGENAWIKVKEGVLAGFSIGGRVNDRVIRTMEVDGKDKAVPVITDYTLGETSLVDNPAVASAIFQMVKSVDGQLQEVEKMETGIGRPVHWYEKAYKYSDSQNIMRASIVTYNEDSMSNKSESIEKSLWEAGMLVELAMCLADYIYWKAWEGEDMSELKVTLSAIQEAASKEVLEPEEFPQIEIENAMKALNLSKREELESMAQDIKNAKEEVTKSVVGQEDRDADGNVVVTAEENGKPVEETVVADEEVAEEVTEEAEVEVADDADTEDADDKSDKGKSKKSASAEMKKTTEDNDLAKSILAGVSDLIEKSVAPLKEEIENLKKLPAASKVKSTYSVKKGEDVDGDSNTDDNSTEGNLRKEFDEQMKRAEELSKDANVGTAEERTQVAFKLRKLSRQLDPASVAKNEAVRATFNRAQ